MPRTRLLVSGLTALALAACATTPVSGPDAASRFDTFSAATTANFTSYEQVFVEVVASQKTKDRVGYRPATLSDRVRPLSQRDLDRQLADLEAFVKDEVGRRATLADAAGPGVLTVAITVTGLEANMPTQAELAANVGLSIQSRYVGGGTATIEFSENGTVLATAEDSNLGDRILDDVTPGMWNDARQFYRRLANKVGSLLG